jgi:hypothetical protein
VPIVSVMRHTRMREAPGNEMRWMIAAEQRDRATQTQLARDFVGHRAPAAFRDAA